MRKILVMMAVGVALLAMAPAAEAHWRNGYRAGGNVVVVRPFPRVGFGWGWGYPYWGGYYGYPYAYGYYPPVVYTAPPPGVYAPPPAAPAPAAPAPDIQREVIYPHGKYLLEGDGMNTAYHWTWIPSPDSAPPPPVEPSSPQSEPAKPKE
jgi:hypothetical protein